MARVLIAGCGYVGARLARFLVEDGDDVFGLKRDPRSLPGGVEPVAADVTEPDALEEMPRDLDHLVYAVSPSGRSEAAYRAAYLQGFRNVREAVRQASPGLRRTLLISSTGAYGYADGRWVDEETPPNPSTPRAEVLVEAETAAWSGPVQGTVLRLGGIYGPGRTATLRRVLTGKADCPDEDRYSNRIHRDDAAGAARHLLRLPDPEGLYLGVDREPARLRELYRWIARVGGGPDPCGGARPGVQRTGRRRRGSKRCRSDRLVASGYTFRFPSYREGYAPLM